MRAIAFLALLVRSDLENHQQKKRLCNVSTFHTLPPLFDSQVGPMAAMAANLSPADLPTTAAAKTTVLHL